jgi:hypothetical protein
VDKIINKDFDFLLKSPHDLHKVFYYESTSNLLRPRVMVEYEREPFVLDAGRLRITFDKNVRAGLEGFDIFNKEMPMIETLDPERLILEVKYTEFLPKLIQEVIPAKASDHAAVSKYIMCCDKTLHKKYSYL